MRILVAGGAGFIGSHLCEHLLKLGHTVVCVDNFCTSSPKNISPLISKDGLQLLEIDIVRGVSLDGELDYVLHLASPASPKHYLRLPVETLMAGSVGTRNLLELARAKKAVFLLASTSEVYGDPLEHPQREDYWGNVNPIGPRSVYDESKRFAEAITSAYHRTFGVQIRIARIFNTYGPRMQQGDGRVMPNFITQALRGEPITLYGDGSQTRSFCYVADMVDGLCRLMLSKETRPVNLGNPQERTVRELAKEVVRLTESRSPIVESPLPVDDPKRRCPVIARAKESLGWEPRVSLEEGLRSTIAWFRSQEPPLAQE